ncbi:MAG: MBL fold metallo-hydrolase, partial [Actinomycetota bacterium]|nr:MBL fold metallo-hydrolase [Actinomycetota bacterium]
MSFEKGLHELGQQCFAYLQPDGSWGWSNAGLVVGDGASLLVDTLFDLPLTAEMLASMAPVTAAAPIGTLLNTHANGDHCYGNQLVEGAEIIASDATAHEMTEVPPAMLHALNTAPGEVG